MRHNMSGFACKNKGFSQIVAAMQRKLYRSMNGHISSSPPPVSPLPPGEVGARPRATGEGARASPLITLRFFCLKNADETAH